LADVRYEIDADGVIRDVNPAWDAFARANGAPELAGGGAVGRNVWDFVAGDDVQRLYRLLFARIPGRGVTCALPFRCDGPEVRRFMRLKLSPRGPGGVICATRLLREERRPAVGVLAADAPRSARLLAICSWCKRVRAESGCWLELEDALASLDLARSAPPSLGHTICTACDARVAAGLPDLEERP
jgi:hypothetical protein